MAISSTDNDGVKRQSEEYRKQLSEKEKNHQKEIKRLREEHYNKMRQADNEYKMRAEELRRSMNAKLTEKDQHYQAEMEKIQEVNRERMQKLSQDNNQRIRLSREQADSQVNDQKEISQRQRDNVEKTYTNEIKKMDKNFRDFADHSRVKQKEALDSQASRIKKARDEEKDILVINKKNDAEKYQKNLQIERDARRQEVSRLNQRLEDQKNDMTNSFRRTIERDRAFQDDVLKAQRISQKDGIDSVKARYAEALKDYQEERNGADSSFKNDVKNRVQDKMNSLEQTNLDLKKKHLSETLLKKKQHDAEKNQILRASKRSNDIIRNNAEANLEQTKKNHGKEITEILDNEHKKTVHNTQFYQEKIEKIKKDNRLVSMDKDANYEIRNKQVRDVANQRIANITEKSAVQEKVIREQYEGNLESLKSNYAKEKNDLQEKYVLERKEAIDSLNKKFQEAQAKHDKQQAMERAKHEKEIQEAGYMHKKEKNRMLEVHKRTIEDLQKMQTRQLEQYKEATDAKLNEVNRQHREEITRIEQRHMKEMEDLAQSKAKI